MSLYLHLKSAGQGYGLFRGLQLKKTTWMNTITITPIFLPNGKDKDGYLHYSIWFDLTPVTIDAGIAKALRGFPDFIQKAVFTIKDTQGNGNVLADDITPNLPNAGQYWNILFKDDLKAWDVPVAAGKSSYWSLSQPTELNNFITNHHVNRVVNRKMLSTVFPAGTPEAQAVSAYQKEVGDSCSNQTVRADCVEVRRRISLIGGLGSTLWQEETTSSLDIGVVLAHVKKHPYLMKRMGLIFVPNNKNQLIGPNLLKPPSTGNTQVKCSVKSSGTANPVFQFAPDAQIIPTNVSQTTKLFLMLPRDQAPDNYQQTLFQNGMFNLQYEKDQPRFELVQNNSPAVAFQEPNLPATGPAAGGKGSGASALPPNATNGIYLVENTRDTNINAIIKANFDGSYVKKGYFLEHFLAGFRFDLRTDATKPWKCLNSGYEVFQLKGQAAEKDPKQPGWTSFTTAVETQDGRGLISEVLCHFTGWGLNSYNPLQYAALAAKGKSTTKPAGQADPSILYLQGQIKINTEQGPSSLCPLRIGQAYALQARLVTIDGYSIQPEESDASTAISTNYYRLDAVSPVTLVLRDKVYDEANCVQTPIPAETGASANTLVIRSTDNSQPSQEKTTRGLAPGSISWHIGEWLGIFDDKGVYASPDLVMQSAKFLPQYDGNKQVIPGTGSYLPNGDKRPDVPYLADPWSDGFEIICQTDPNFSVNFKDCPGLNFFTSGLAWWDLKSWELVVREIFDRPLPGAISINGGNILVDVTNRKIHFKIPKGSELSFVVRAFPLDPKIFINNNKSLQRIIAGATTAYQKQLPGATPAQITNFQQTISQVFNNSYPTRIPESGGIRDANLFSETTFRIVHALKTPLANPAFAGPVTVLRTWNPAEATLGMWSGLVAYPDTTARKLELYASWTDYFDTDELTYTNLKIGEFILNGIVQKNLCQASSPEGVWILGTVNPGGDTVPTMDKPQTLNFLQNFRDTRFRQVTYNLKAVSAFTEFFPARANENADVFSLYAAQTTNAMVLSSVAPAPPKVAYIMPAFEWEYNGNVRTRRGNRLRVYLERPWNITGKGEQLAVVLSGNTGHEGTSHYGQFVSKWGRDVTTYSDNLAELQPENLGDSNPITGLTLNNPIFKSRKVIPGAGGCLSVQEKITNAFQIVPLDVNFNHELQLWYADIVLSEPQSYRPFVQLSFARYQKNSIANEELSNSTLCQFVQLSPTRTLTIQRRGRDFDLTLFATTVKSDGDITADFSHLKNEVYIRIPANSNVNKFAQGFAYTICKEDPNTHLTEWIPVTQKTVQKGGVLWTFHGHAEIENYSILIKEFEIFGNSSPEADPEANPAKRLVYGDVIE
jgi:hypothetical protein